ncbi:DUF445 domain-containing protein [Paenibacillus nanensis]|uniref:DUF445 domain-containing protein n=1 Tax=Paenibacillus nanensis TaxID=393251 RepID=A0A3A1VHH8_9BACL|nr:DUF445 domain-containing protein [Paenibacillus nanensis]RIX59725.1 DUF445 domain-containing protein [Paenibacillus nanensis]
MEKRSVRKRANAILAISAAGILAAFPFQHTFVGGLLFAAFSAGTIGGLADSFAISALFGDPLRIKWPKWMGTHIISRNRERLIGELVDMVGKELLTVEAIRATLQEHDLGGVIARYVTGQEGSREARAIVKKLAGELLASADAEQIAEGLQQLITEHGDALQLSDLLADIGDWSVRHKYDDKILSFVIEPFVQLVKSHTFRSVIEQFAATAIRSYEGDKLRRRLVDYTAGLNASSIAGKVQDWLAAFLEQLAHEDSPRRLELKELLLIFIRRLREDEALRHRVESGKRKLLEALKPHIRLEALLSKRLNEIRADIVSPQDGNEGNPEPSKLIQWLLTELDHGLDLLRSRPDLQQSLDTGVKTLLLSWIEEKHALIGALVKEKLESYTERELIEMVKDKAGRDLQYIRLNGMIVGSAAGIVLHLFTFWIRGG